MKLFRSIPALLLAAGALVAAAGPAAAHVTVQPPEAAAGSYAKLTFRVPNESDDAGTVRLEVSFPEEPVFGSVRVKPRPGWSVEIDKEELPEPVEVGHGVVTEAVRSITWTATEGVRIGPDEFDEFEVSVGPVPDVDRLAFPAVQTYDDGEEVIWDETVAPGEPDPDRPAPMLTIVDAGSSVDPATARVADESEAAPPPADGTDGTARALGTAGLIVAVLGLLAGALGIGLARRGATS